MKRLLLIVILLLLAGQVPGIVAFNGFNQRNHPELDWKSIQTENCKIIYHDPLEAQARLTAGIAQNTFDTLVKTYNITPQKTCIIYVSDQDNIANGAAAMSFYIFIWINQNDFTAQFTGNDKWIRKVVSHEISHWFVAASIEGWLTPWVPMFPNIPRNINEGYAQYFSGEPWGYNRGDRFLKASILSQETKVPSPEVEGHLMYADGFSKVRYLAAKYGEEKLIELLKYRNDGKLFAFGAAFKEVYKQSYSEFEEEWRRHVYTYYYGEVYKAKSCPADTSSAGNINDFTALATDYYQFNNLDWKNDKLLFVARKSANQGYYDLLLAEVAADSLKSDKLKLNKARSIFKTGRFTKISLSENGNWAAFAVYTRHQKGRLAPRIYQYDTQNHKLQSFSEGNYPEIDGEGGIYYQKLSANSNDIFYLSPDLFEKSIYSLGFDEQIGNLSLSPDGQKLAFSVFDSDKQFNISILELKHKQVSQILALTGMALSLKWNNDDELLYTLENKLDFSLDIFMYNLATQSTQEFAQTPYNATPIRYLDDKMYVMADFDQGAKLPGWFTPQPPLASAKTFTENYYNKWLHVQPLHSIPDSLGQIQFSQPESYNSWLNIKWRLGFALPLYRYAAGGFLFSEALGKHLLGGFAAIPYSKNDRAWWMLMYQNKTLAPTIDLMYSRDQWFSGVGEDGLYYQDMDKLSGKISFPVNLIRPFQEMDLSLGLSYTDLRDVNSNPIFRDRGFAALACKAGYSYDLPWRNSNLHKVRSYGADYSLQMASGALGMNTDFNQHALHAGFAYAPLLFKTDSELLRTVSLESRAHYEFVNGEQLPQFLPGTDQYAIIQSGNRPAFKRYYLRGYEASFLSKKILNLQNEINIKVMNDMDFNLFSDMISIHYTGVSFWHDYTQLEDILDSSPKNRSYNANGFELRAETHLLFVPVIMKFGTAYDNKFKKLSDYFLLEIPFLEMIQDQL